MSNFDFNKAINGEPIYYKNEEIYPTYTPSDETWRLGELFWHKSGNSYLISSISLTTDPPRKKVKKTVWIGIFKYDNERYYGSTSAYKSKGDAEKAYVHHHDFRLGIYPIEIEVEE